MLRTQAADQTPGGTLVEVAEEDSENSDDDLRGTDRSTALFRGADKVESFINNGEEVDPLLRSARESNLDNITYEETILQESEMIK